MITTIDKSLPTVAKEEFKFPSDLKEVKRLTDLIYSISHDIDCRDETQIYEQMGKIQAFSWLLKRETDRL